MQSPPSKTNAPDAAGDAQPAANEGPSSPPAQAPKAEPAKNEDPPTASPSPPVEENEEATPQEATFPQQLMDAIEMESTEGTSYTDDHERILEWLPEGKSFVIRDKAKLEREVLPKHFSAKCKFMSFVRKLYRWGFRQVEKQVPGVMTFTHANFVRGDKKRCLLMRSVVKKQQPQPAANAHANLAATQFAALQAFGANGAFGGMMDPNMLRNALAAQYGGAFPPQQGLFNALSLTQGGANPLLSMNANQLQLPGQGMSMQPNQFSQGNNMMTNQLPKTAGGNNNGMTSSDLFEAGLRLKEMEQQQQMLGGGNATAPGMNNGLGAGAAAGNVGGMSEIELASEMMRRDASIDPRRALELARCFGKK